MYASFQLILVLFSSHVYLTCNQRGLNYRARARIYFWFYYLKFVMREECWKVVTSLKPQSILYNYQDQRKRKLLNHIIYQIFLTTSHLSRKYISLRRNKEISGLRYCSVLYYNFHNKIIRLLMSVICIYIVPLPPAASSSPPPLIMPGLISHNIFANLTVDITSRNT